MKLRDIVRSFLKGVSYVTIPGEKANTLQTLDESEIVEYNAIQCSGHYLADTGAIIKGLYDLAISQTN